MIQLLVQSLIGFAAAVPVVVLVTWGFWRARQKRPIS
jgi:hypothetical protein